MRGYNNYQLQELFSNINILLQENFGFKGLTNNSKTDLTKQIYNLYLSNGDEVFVKINKNSIPYLFGINIGYLRSTGMYKNKSTYDMMTEFIGNYRKAIMLSNKKIIKLDKILPYCVENKTNSLIENLNIDIDKCKAVIKYDNKKAYSQKDKSIMVSYLIIQEKNNKYYVLQLAKYKNNDNKYYPISNQVFDSYDKLIKKISPYIKHQEVTFLLENDIYYNDIKTKSYMLKEDKAKDLFSILNDNSYDEYKIVNNLIKYHKSNEGIIEQKELITKYHDSDINKVEMRKNLK